MKFYWPKLQDGWAAIHFGVFRSVQYQYRDDARLEWENDAAALFWSALIESLKAVPAKERPEDILAIFAAY